MRLLLQHLLLRIVAPVLSVQELESTQFFNPALAVLPDANGKPYIYVVKNALGMEVLNKDDLTSAALVRSRSLREETFVYRSGRRFQF